MDELISKEQALKVIADYQGGSVNKVVAKELLEALPEAVVRCKDCVFHSTKSGLCHMWSAFGSIITADDCFCKYGESEKDG